MWQTGTGTILFLLNHTSLIGLELGPESLTSLLSLKTGLQTAVYSKPTLTAPGKTHFIFAYLGGSGGYCSAKLTWILDSSFLIRKLT